jgi:hypothetical protein
VIINELAQWAVLIFIAIFVVGLTRQLGDFLVPKKEQLASDIGPPMGKKLPAGLFSSQEHRQVRELMQERSVGWATLLIVAENCPGCGSLLEHLQTTKFKPPDRAPVIALSRKSSPSHERSLREAADLVIVDGDRLKTAGLTVTPFAVIVDSSLTVLHKQLAWDLQEVLDTWRQQDGGDPHQREDEQAATEPSALQGT